MDGVRCGNGGDDGDPGDVRELKSIPRGDRREEFLARFFMRHRGRLAAMVSMRIDPRVRRRIDPSDVLQDAFLAASGALDRYLANARISLFPWIRCITRRTLQEIHRMHLGARCRDPRMEIYLGSPSPAAADSLAGAVSRPDDGMGEALRQETKELLRKAFEKLHPGDREVLALRDFEGLSSAQAARAMGVREEAARKRHLRARGRLKRVIARMHAFRRADRIA